MSLLSKIRIPRLLSATFYLEYFSPLSHKSLHRRCYFHFDELYSGLLKSSLFVSFILGSQKAPNGALDASCLNVSSMN